MAIPFLPAGHLLEIALLCCCMDSSQQACHTTHRICPLQIPQLNQLVLKSMVQLQAVRTHTTGPLQIPQYSRKACQQLNSTVPAAPAETAGSNLYQGAAGVAGEVLAQSAIHLPNCGGDASMVQADLLQRYALTGPLNTVISALFTRAGRTVMASMPYCKGPSLVVMFAPLQSASVSTPSELSPNATLSNSSLLLYAAGLA